MIGKSVKHAIFGEGLITETKDSKNPHKKLINVRFENRESTFLFPDAFFGFLTTDSEELLDLAKKAKGEIEAEARIVICEPKPDALRRNVSCLTEREGRAVSDKIALTRTLKKGASYGTNAKKIFEACADALGWDSLEKKCFGWQTPNYSEVATPEGYSVWFLAYSNWQKGGSGRPENIISETYMEQWWPDTAYPRATARRRVIFAKRGGAYYFLGIFEFVGSVREEIRDGRRFWVERFNRVSTNYPEAN